MVIQGRSPNFAFIKRAKNFPNSNLPIITSSVTKTLFNHTYL